MKQKYLYLIVSTVLLLPTKSIKELHYALFTSGPEEDFDSSRVIPAMELAGEEIFKDPFTLKGFRLSHIPIQDTMVGIYWLEKLAIALSDNPLRVKQTLLEPKKHRWHIHNYYVTCYEKRIRLGKMAETYVL